MVFLIAIVIACFAMHNTVIEALVETDFFNQIFGSEPKYITRQAEKLGLRSRTQETDTAVVPIAESETSSASAAPLSETGGTAAPAVSNSAVSAVPAPASGQTDFSNSVMQNETPPKQMPDADAKLVFSQESEQERLEKQAELQKSLSVAKKLPEQEPQSVRQTTVFLYFVAIDADGTVIRKEIEKQLPYTKTPLTAAINTLLHGPEFSETERGYMSLVPQNVKLLSASIENRVAVLNFSEDFLYNKFGVEGYLGQLMQIVYTATAFTTIDSVLFLINGEKQEYLGGEGVWIGTPLARSSFK